MYIFSGTIIFQLNTHWENKIKGYLSTIIKKSKKYDKSVIFQNFNFQILIFLLNLLIILLWKEFFFW